MGVFATAYGIHWNSGWPLTPKPSQHSLVWRLITSVRWSSNHPNSPPISLFHCVLGVHLSRTWAAQEPLFTPTLSPNIQPSHQMPTTVAEEKPRTNLWRGLESYALGTFELWTRGFWNCALGTCVRCALSSCKMCTRRRPERDCGRVAGGELVSCLC